MGMADIWCGSPCPEVCTIDGCCRGHVGDICCKGMVPRDLLQKMAKEGREWLKRADKHQLLEVGNDMAREVNLCTANNRSPDLKSLFDTLIQHLTFLPIETMSRSLRQCLKAFLMVIYSASCP
eukprot:TRINITY_DN4037_c1_g1_i1.p1 TRINITY_DN4037_c1_g1~~TRINITY_DN4037_c1_g1_i1.p1  ORF type:complete len:143 (+),score=29.74 TRINITY_DN4037_c1_g1_i1:61-429(+)